MLIVETLQTDVDMGKSQRDMLEDLRYHEIAFTFRLGERAMPLANTWNGGSKNLEVLLFSHDVPSAFHDQRTYMWQGWKLLRFPLVRIGLPEELYHWWFLAMPTF